MNADRKHSELTELISKAFYAAYNALGYGFLEKVYVNALVIEMEKLGMKVEQQVPIHVYYAAALWESTVLTWLLKVW